MGGERITQLEDALRALLRELGEPWDIDQDCRFCAGHYDWHESDCAWWVARSALDSSTGSEQTE